MDWWIYVFWFFAVFVIVFVARSVYIRRTRPQIEFKCLEHMCPLDEFDAETFTWRCPTKGCEAFVDCSIAREFGRKQYPPK